MLSANVSFLCGVCMLFSWGFLPDMHVGLISDSKIVNRCVCTAQLGTGAVLEVLI